MLHHDPLVSDFIATAISGVVATSFLKLWEETAKRRLFDQVSLNCTNFEFLLRWVVFNLAENGAKWLMSRM
jgi:farnesol kinase